MHDCRIALNDLRTLKQTHAHFVISCVPYSSAHFATTTTVDCSGTIEESAFIACGCGRWCGGARLASLAASDITRDQFILRPEVDESNYYYELLSVAFAIAINTITTHSAEREPYVYLKEPQRSQVTLNQSGVVI